MYDRKKAKADLLKQQKESAANSSGFVGVLKDGIPVWKCGEGKHKIDILPFTVGKKHPTLPAGSAAYKLDLFSHYGVGVNNDTYICMNKMFKKFCSICEHKSELQQSGDADADQIKKLKPSHNTLYNIICYDTPEEERKGVQVWMVNNWFMESKLMAIAEDESGEPIQFPDPDDGKRITFTRKGTGKANTQYLGHKLVDRDYKISDKLLNSTFTLDEIIVIPKEEDVEQAFFGAKRESNKVEKDEDEGNNYDNKKGDILNVKDNLGDMTRKELKAFIEENKLNINAGDYDEKEDLVNDIKEALNKNDDVPASKGEDNSGILEDEINDMSRKELKELIKDKNIDIDTDDYETKDELKEAVKDKLFREVKKEDKKEESKEKVCPNKKGTFGESFDQFPACVNECDLFDACSDEYDKIKAAKKSSGSKLNRR